MEVPTIISYSSLQLRMEQNVDIPAPGRGGRISGLQGFLPEQSSTAFHGSLERISERTVEQNVDIPAVGASGTGGGPSGFLPGQNYSVTVEQIVDNPVRPGGVGDLQSLPRGQGSTAFLELIADFPDPVGGQQDFQPVQGSAASSSDLPGQAGQGVFRTFPQNKKSAKIPRTQGSELPPHSSPWTPAPCEASMVLEEEEEEEEEKCEEDFEVEYVEYDDRLWGREWVAARAQDRA